jgi:hypothetical protein
MDEHAYIGELLTAVFFLVVGTRLFQLARKTGEVPERLLGALFLTSGVSYFVYVLPVLIGSEALWTPLNFLGRLLYLPAPIILAVFTRRVFRPNGSWATWIVLGTVALLVVGVGGSVLTGDWEGYSVGSAWFLAEWVGYTIPFAWAGAEAFVQYGGARRRRQHGLCDPLVCNRFLLWGFFGALSVGVSLLILPMYAYYERHGQFSAFWDSIVGAGEVASIVVVWLIFFPPVSYRHWIAAGATRAGAVE